MFCRLKYSATSCKSSWKTVRDIFTATIGVQQIGFDVSPVFGNIVNNVFRHGFRI